MSVYRVGTNKSSTNVFPSIRPSLDLDFANTKTLDPRITFTRASGGTYVGADGLIKYAGVNEARFDHDPVTGESLGLLVEEARTNLFLHNTKHNETRWINQNSSGTINTTETLSPDGTNNATKLFGNNGITIRQSIYQRRSVTSGTTYTFSVFLKQGQRRYATIWFDSADVSPGVFWGSGSIIDLQTGILATGSQTVVIPYPNGWYRCYVTATPTATQSINMNLSVGGPNNNSGAPYDATGDGSSGIYIWGHQLEEGAFPTSYIPTQESTRTRQPDIATITGKNFSDFYNPTQSTVVWEGVINSTPISGSRIFEFYDVNTDTESFSVSVAINGLMSARIRDSNSDTATTFAIENVIFGKKYKISLSVNNKNSINLSVNGNITTINIINYSINSANRLIFTDLRTLGGTRKFTTRHKYLTYYPKALPPSQIQALTR